MKAINGLLVSLIAGSCATVALADNRDDVTHYIQPKVAHQPMRALHIDLSGNGGFGTRAATQMDYYSNVNTGAGSYIFYGTGLNESGEPIFLEKGGTDDLGDPIGPVASPGKFNEVELWMVTSNGTSASAPFDCTITVELFAATVDFANLGSTCLPSGDDSVAQISLGGFYSDLTLQNYALYVITYSGLEALYGPYFNWNVLDGNCFVDIRGWDPSGGGLSFTRTGNGLWLFPAFDGMSPAPCAIAPDAYPTLGMSFNNFYHDGVTIDGHYSRGERYFFGNDNNFLSNLMVRFAGNDGCSLDLNGDGFVGGVDVDYVGLLIDAGCGY